MRFSNILLLCGSILAGACGPEPGQPEPDLPEPSGPPLAQERLQPADPAPQPPAVAAPRWELVAQPGGAKLDWIEQGQVHFELGCDASGLVVFAPGFDVIGSEERFALALGEEPVTLVAEVVGQSPGNGVRATGATPSNFARLLDDAERIGGLYGTQQAGPYPAPSQALKAQLSEACSRE